MRRRCRSRAADPSNLDSFLDVMTNTVGVLVFVLLVVVLAAADARVLVRTPLFSPSPKTGVIYEVTGDRVALVPTEEGDEIVDGFWRGLPEITLWNASQIIRRVYAFNRQVGEYEIDYVGSFMNGSLGVRYQALHGAVGEPRRALRDSTSAYRQRLAEVDGETEFVFFLVRPDGYEAFREARKHAWARGIETGWEPMEHADEIVFSSRGRAIGVQ